MNRSLLLLLALLVFWTVSPSLAQPGSGDDASADPDALSDEALDRMVRVDRDSLNFDDVIRTVGPESRRLESYDLRWIQSNRVSGRESFPVVADRIDKDMQVLEKNLPWSSGYWPHVTCQLAFGRTGTHSLSPMEKLDTLVLTETGRNPCAAAWEANPKNKHNKFALAYEKPRNGHEEANPKPKMIKMRAPDGTEYEIAGDKRYGWHGHCNGWAGAACVVPQPPATLDVNLRNPLKVARLKYANFAEAYDMNSEGEDQYKIEQKRDKKLTFTRSDLKGLLTESFMDCVAKMSHPIIRSRYQDNSRARDRGYVYNGVTLDHFEGSERTRVEERLRTEGGAPFKDVFPHNFHRICLDYLGARNQPFVTEIDADAKKDNHPTYGYSYTQRYDASSKEYTFKATVTYATYADPSFNGPKALKIPYTFKMKLDDRNRIVESEWTGSSEFDHPDFIWVPVENVPPGEYENKNLDFDVLQRILQGTSLAMQEQPGTEGVFGGGGGSEGGMGTGSGGSEIDVLSVEGRPNERTGGNGVVNTPVTDVNSNGQLRNRTTRPVDPSSDFGSPTDGSLLGGVRSDTDGG